MKLITAVIAPHGVDPVIAALTEAGVSGMTVTEVQGYGRQHGHSEVYRGASVNISLVSKIRLDIVVDDKDAETITALVVSAAHSGHIGDGKVWVTPVEQIIRVRTGERGGDAV